MSRIQFKLPLAFLCASALALSAKAELTLHGLFTDHAVLQQGDEIPVWGTSDSNESVVVRLGDVQVTQVPANGKWMVRLDGLQAGGPHELKITQGQATVERKDIYIGEVWLCSGQSNMAWKVARVKNAQQEIAAADYPQIRMINIPGKPSKKPLEDVRANWMVCSPKTVGGFSGTAYFFGRALHEELGVPIGLINSSVGGTPIEAWTSLKTHETNEHLRPILQQQGDAAGKDVAQLYNGMIAPLAPYGMRGAIWYQGERNSRFGDPKRYRHQLLAMIENWRAAWGKSPDEFAFLFVQLPNYTAAQKRPVETTGWVLIREGMLETLASAPNSGMAVTVDIGEPADIHPKNKQDVGRRLALWALGTTYHKGLVYSGPLFESFEFDGDKARLTFEHVGEGLSSNDQEPLAGFAIAGEDQEFVWADAMIEGRDTIVVSSPKVKQPMAVRYAWASNPKGNLTNGSGLPASPFRTDDWEE